MKFTGYETLENFVRENLFSDCIEMQEIYTGGSSFNFKVKTGTGEYLLKLTGNEMEYRKLSLFVPLFYPLYPLKQQKFHEYYLMAMPFIHGRSLRYGDVNAKLMAQLAQSYRHLEDIASNPEYILPQQHLKTLFENAETLVKQEKGVLGWFLRRFMTGIKRHTVDIDNKNQVIHGDLSVNNILVDQNGQPYILDFESVRYGKSVEDVAALMLQLSGFRGLTGCLYKFAHLRKMVDNEHRFSPQEWLYGVQFFYLKRLCRRCRQTGKNSKKQNFRKSICFMMSLMRYFQIEKYLTD
ncbi:MAG: aminoglycoside phosphotransferase family protein [Alphaproteobacteria bacterium]|nr:aminoglycoside phosphotransferase family protein [Alphaproteobacteria bacterium]